jgi:TonB-dependent SusC/RagA subfamily outer membrane receptor
MSGDRLTQIDPTIPLEEQITRIPGVYQAPSGEIRIRGSNSAPLFVLDGAPMMGQDLSFINPADVEDIEVLKGSEAAIYGARGGGGVIRINTKRPPGAN